MNEKKCHHCQKTFYEEYHTRIKYCNDCITEILLRKPELYDLLIESGLIMKRQKQVLEIIKLYPNSTATEIGELAHIKINVICGRKKELKDMGLIECSGKRECSITHQKVDTWALKEQLDLNKTREWEKIKEK